VYVAPGGVAAAADAPRKIPLKRHGQMMLFDGAVRELLMPRARDAEQPRVT